VLQVPEVAEAIAKKREKVSAKSELTAELLDRKLKRSSTSTRARSSTTTAA
jgi:hypothetical protein